MITCIYVMLQNEPVSETTVQEELEMIWTALQMPDCLKLDMALKYSSDCYRHLLPSVSWRLLYHYVTVTASEQLDCSQLDQ